MMKTIIRRSGLILLAYVMTLASTMAVLPTKVSALSGSEFQAGRIMDDSVFFNGNTINVQQIQEFLNAKVPTCDTNGTQPYAGTTRAAYGASRGYPAPYICLKDFRQDTVAKSAETGLCNGYGVANQSAAEIIYNVGVSCGVNPKVLIVLLEKEQSLVTDDWPWSIQYRSATGFGCPDTAPCDAEYYGFFNQVYSAARQFKRYARDSHLFNYSTNTTSYVLYNPNTGCGGSNIYLQNQATAGLYNYTPYQPNAAALNNLYGTGDGCSAYGNRNFWRLYNDWFGSTFAPNYDWSLISQSLYTDSSKTTNSSSNILAGNKAYAVLKIKNTGNQTWSKTGANPVRLGTVRPLERQSPFCDSTWISCSRPASMVETSVAPGGTATFEFWLQTPAQGGQFNEYFGPVVEGIQWLRDIGLFYGINVQPPIYSWQMMSQYTNKDMANLRTGDQITVGFTAKNTGNMTWSNTGPNPIRVGTISPIERSSIFAPGSSWLGVSRAASMQEASVAPGGIGTFEFTMTVPPNSPGTYHERFGLVVEGRTWLNDVGLSYYARVVPDTYTWQMMSQYVYTDASKTAVRDMANLRAGEKIYVGFTAKNTGNVTWTNNGANPVRVGTLAPIERSSVFAPGSSWLGSSRPGQLVEASVPPGGTGTFEFWLTVPPNSPGTYHERFGLVVEGRTWLNDVGLSYYARVL